jgi:hypothetical protein
VTKVLLTATDSKCRLCKHLTVEHITSACLISAKEQYIKRHDIVCAQLHCNICKEIGVIFDNEHWYDHIPHQSIRVLMVRETYYGINKCKMTDSSLTINRKP